MKVQRILNQGMVIVGTLGGVIVLVSRSFGLRHADDNYMLLISIFCLLLSKQFPGDER